MNLANIKIEKLKLVRKTAPDNQNVFNCMRDPDRRIFKIDSFLFINFFLFADDSPHANSLPLALWSLPPLILFKVLLIPHPAFEGNTRNKALYDLIQKLPRTNFNVFERLIYHLAQVAQQVKIDLHQPKNPKVLPF